MSRAVIPGRRHVGILLCVSLFILFLVASFTVYSPARLHSLTKVGHHTASTVGLSAVSSLANGQHEIPPQDSSLTSNFSHASNLYARQCDSISEAHLRLDIARSGGQLSSAAFSLQYHDGILGDGSKDYETGSEFCAVILVPQSKDPLSQIASHDFPVGELGPDAIHAEAASADVRLVFTDHPVYRSTWRTHEYSIYTAGYHLDHPGIYHFNAEVEYIDYDWIMDDHRDVQSSRVRLPFKVRQDIVLSGSAPIRISGRPLARPSNKCFDDLDDRSMDLHGRWYQASSFHPQFGNQTALNPHAGLEFAATNGTVDEWGWTFAPDRCTLTYFSPEDHLSCFNSRTIHVLGDSNGRRLTKSLIGGGTGWCARDTSRNDTACQCEDGLQEHIYDMNFTPINATKFTAKGARSDPMVFGHDGQVFFDFVGGLLITPKRKRPWQRVFTGGSNSTVAQRVQRYGSTDVVFVSMITWDIGILRTPDELIDSLPSFRDTLLNAYRRSTRFVIRLSNSLCCGQQTNRRRLTAPRFIIFNEIWRQFWAEDVRQGRVKFDDASVLQGRRDAEMAYGCDKAATHLKSSLVRIEQMMWMSAVCQKVEGTAMMRDWTVL